ncbi:MAG: C39 family peptidase [Gammaproteobacteria bacterium]|nr:C39 family peptidase [Gammaproteobacteria bacterium]
MYPSIRDIPKKLRELEGNCGPISVWMVLERNGIEADPEEIIVRCGHNLEYGSFSICLANALYEYGLSVEFYSDHDPKPQTAEIEAYKKAQDRFSVNKALSLTSLLRKVEKGSSCIVSYATWGGEGHFSPVVSSKTNKVVLAYETNYEMLKSVFRYRWRAPEILRQCVVAT